MKLFRALTFLILLASTCLLGCGDGNSHVTGTLTNNGTPLEVGEKGVVQVQFIQLQDGKPKGFRTAQSVDKVGHFEATVPPGNYRIAILQLDPYPDKDLLKGAFDDRKSPIEKDLSSSQSIEIELAEFQK
ncbi:hypothetical protein C5Y96_07735 [Blastopirellula marina]|uniref:Carboxypeptidase regulatory-like domain-containing protein n=1 Tax=Blastopirellula marina TaxID=124 RepID=A0A2S8FY91_9BACT|nr:MULTISPECIES: hypothetical protein [Pirellulaceae]PQO37040.1 hypothetical protein C5Y96_07735 [Blastopirellula marina]RCS53755.1 hypothetical protein DTL36_07745 [Bremerella cremea]